MTVSLQTDEVLLVSHDVALEAATLAKEGAARLGSAGAAWKGHGIGNEHLTILMQGMPVLGIISQVAYNHDPASMLRVATLRRLAPKESSITFRF